MTNIFHLVSISEQVGRKESLSPVGTLLAPLTRAPFVKSPTRSSGPFSLSRTPPLVRSASSQRQKRKNGPTLSDEPVMTPQPPARSAGQRTRTMLKTADLVTKSGIRAPCPPWSKTQPIGRRKRTFSLIFASGRWCHRASIRGTGLISCTGARCSRRSTLQPPHTATVATNGSALRPSTQISNIQRSLFPEPRRRGAEYILASPPPENKRIG